MNGKVAHNKGVSDCCICAVKQEYCEHAWNLESTYPLRSISCLIVFR